MTRSAQPAGRDARFPRFFRNRLFHLRHQGIDLPLERLELLFALGELLVLPREPREVGLERDLVVALGFALKLRELRRERALGVHHALLPLPALRLARGARLLDLAQGLVDRPHALGALAVRELRARELGALSLRFATKNL